VVPAVEALVHKAETECSQEGTLRLLERRWQNISFVPQVGYQLIQSPCTAV